MFKRQKFKFVDSYRCQVVSATLPSSTSKATTDSPTDRRPRARRKAERDFADWLAVQQLQQAHCGFLQAIANANLCAQHSAALPSPSSHRQPTPASSYTGSHTNIRQPMSGAPFNGHAARPRAVFAPPSTCSGTQKRNPGNLVSRICPSLEPVYPFMSQSPPAAP